MSVYEKMTAIADAIRDKTGETEKLGLDAMVDGVNKVYDSGVQTEYDRFWDSFQQNGTRRNYPNGFSGSCWNDDTYNPKYEIIVTNLCVDMFKNNSVITSTKVPITIDTTSANSTGVFTGCSRLREIPSIKVTAKVPTFASWFHGCNALTTINFTKDSVIAKSIDFQWCPLTSESVQSIIDHLMDLTGKAAQTLTLHATVGAKLAEDQKAAITAKNWTLVY